MSDVILNSQNLYKSYNDGASEVHVLKDINLSISRGDRVAIIGPSGSGKSTLLHLMGGLDKPTTGTVCIDNINWHHVNEKQRCQLRNQHLGFIYQFHHLLPEFTAVENVTIPLVLGHKRCKNAETRAKEMLCQVGLNHRLGHKPAQLSGGERQRVAIARALVGNPHCVLADEPTGNLDQNTAHRVLELMLDLNKKLGTALVIVTHDQQIAKRMDRVLELQEGSIFGAP